jgi:hypothetical protein
MQPAAPPLCGGGPPPSPSAPTLLQLFSGIILISNNYWETYTFRNTYRCYLIPYLHDVLLRALNWQDGRNMLGCLTAFQINSESETKSGTECSYEGKHSSLKRTTTVVVIRGKSVITANTKSALKRAPDQWIVNTPQLHLRDYGNHHPAMPNFARELINTNWNIN